jgi:hypothetical protein
MIRPFLAGVVVLLALSGCQATNPPAASAPAVTATLAAGSCHMRTEDGQPLPDPVCTPGALNPAVTQQDIRSTICKRGWTATIRPPESYTEPLKRRSISAYGYSDHRLADYEFDHLVSLELGGAPRDTRNLWAEPGASPNAKDQVESDLNHAVCSGRVTLAAAQQQIATDWVKLGRSLGVLH